MFGKTVGSEAFVSELRSLEDACGDWSRETGYQVAGGSEFFRSLRSMTPNVKGTGNCEGVFRKRVVALCPYDGMFHPRLSSFILT